MASQPTFDLPVPGRPNQDKQFCVMPGISHASFQQKNYLMAYHILHAYFSQPEPAYRG